MDQEEGGGLGEARERSREVGKGLAERGDPLGLAQASLGSLCGVGRPGLFFGETFKLHAHEERIVPQRNSLNLQLP